MPDVQRRRKGSPSRGDGAAERTRSSTRARARIIQVEAAASGLQDKSPALPTSNGAPLKQPPPMRVGPIGRLWARWAESIDRRWGWQSLLPLLGALTLMGLRTVLRRENL